MLFFCDFFCHRLIFRAFFFGLDGLSGFRDVLGIQPDGFRVSYNFCFRFGRNRDLAQIIQPQGITGNSFFRCIDSVLFFGFVHNGCFLNRYFFHGFFHSRYFFHGFFRGRYFCYCFFSRDFGFDFRFACSELLQDFFQIKTSGILFPIAHRSPSSGSL